MAPDVSIVVLNYNYPDVIARLIASLPMTTGPTYELVVVDNGSEPGHLAKLETYRETGDIDVLVPEPINHWFSEGNNIGVRNCNPGSKYILLLNADTEIVHPEWLSKMVEWMEGIPRALPYTWSDHAEEPHPGPRGIVSVGWSFDVQVPGCARPEGWCLMYRQGAYREMSPDFPFYYGIEEAVAESIRAGNRCGVLCQYSKYITHYECGCETSKRADQIHNRRAPDMRAWFKGLEIDSLDFTLGEHEARSYIEW